MRVVNKKLWVITITLLVVIECVFTYLSVKSYGNKDITEIKEENKVNKEMFSMYVENKDGEYVEYTDSEYYPIGLKYYFNEERSNCTDNKGKVVNDVISYNNNKITVSSNKTLFCYLYFDLDKIPPQTFTFYLGGNTNPEYINKTSTTAYLSWSDNDVTYYCLTKENTSTNCEWTSVNQNPTEIEYTLSNGDGTKTLNAYLKDFAGNISAKITDSMILDTVAPQVSATVNNNYSPNATMTITSNETGTYCVNTNATATTSCTFSGNIIASESITTDVFTTKGDYYAHIIDEAGNVAHSSKVTISLSPPLWKYIIDNSVSGIDKNFIGTDTLYRFSGTTGNSGINNYICLGTSSKCTLQSDDMYRIIGVEPSTGYIKVIKQTNYGSTINWNSATGVNWSYSDAYYASVTWYNSISFKSMIVSHKWNIGDVGGSITITSRSKVIGDEGNSTFTAYVGILSLSDYYMAYRGDKNWYSRYSDYANNWIHISNNGNTSDNEWTMSRSSSTHVYYVANNGRATNGGMSGLSYLIRPVFYLNSDVTRIEGSGTSDDPFLVS